MRTWLIRILGPAVMAGWTLLLVLACKPPPEEVLGIKIRNDTDQRLEIKKCNGAPSCSGFSEDVRRAPGSDWAINVSSYGGVQWLRVFRDDGTTFGCLRLEFNTRVEGVIVKISESTPCPS